jgi:putative ABC transport system ATP-binding protein
MHNDTVIRIDDAVRVFGRGEGAVRALDGVTLGFERGTFTAVMGPSGSGKSTLRQLAAGLDRPTGGHVRLGERDLGDLNERALAKLRRERVGSRHRPTQLSGGQQQRVAIARALVGKPEIVFADEPTCALDTRAGRDVLGLLRETVDHGGRTLVMVTHDPSAAAWADRVVFMADGRLAGELAAPSAEAVAERLTGLGD